MLFSIFKKASPVLASDWLLVEWWAGFETETEVGPRSGDFPSFEGKYCLVNYWQHDVQKSSAISVYLCFFCGEKAAHLRESFNFLIQLTKDKTRNQRK